ncbi:MAG: YafY family protein [Deltaproteobacteria bacterium]
MRTERLLKLLQILRRHRKPVSGHDLAADLGVSIRTLYRDIATLQGQGAGIDGEPGVGYVLQPGFFLPPLMFSQTEIEALMLGMRWTATFADRSLAVAATDALAKIEAILPPEARQGAGAVPLRVGPPASTELMREDLAVFRDAIRRERKLEVTYRGAHGADSRRVIWPFAIGYFNDGRILVGWCETRSDFRHFRTDRIQSYQTLAEPYPRRRSQLFKAWRASDIGPKNQAKNDEKG